MEKTIETIFSIKENQDCEIDYYPHIIKQYENGGRFVQENFSKIDFDDTKEITEYIFRNKKLIVNKMGDREYNIEHQKMTILADGLYVVTKVECIDPNKFPVLHKYYDISHKIIHSKEYKYITISYIQEDDLQYIKLSFPVDTENMKKIIKQLKDVREIIERTSSQQHK